MIKVNNIPKRLSKLQRVSVYIAANKFYNTMLEKKIFSVVEDILENGLEFDYLVENMKDRLRILIFQTDNYFDIVRVIPFKKDRYITGKILLEVV